MKICFAVLLFIGASQGFLVCPENACEGMKCESVENCYGRVDPKGGFCGCCPVCLKQLDHKESCVHHLLGLPKTTECGPGLYCHPETEACEYDCKVRRDAGHGITNTFNRRQGFVGLELPRCEDDGRYSPLQCLGSMCFCVDQRGTGLNRGVNRWEIMLQAQNCRCVRDEAAYDKLGGDTPLVSKLFHCREDGNYDKVQCEGSICFCTHESGMKMEGREPVPIYLSSTLKC